MIDIINNKIISLTVCWIFFDNFSNSFLFHHRYQHDSHHHRSGSRRNIAKRIITLRNVVNDDDNDDDASNNNKKSKIKQDDYKTDEEADWRSFRARLVLEEKQTNNNNNNEDSEQVWAYNAGQMIEKGSILVSCVESSLGCHDLRQPYFFKAVVLIVEHDPHEFTQGILLNRPSNLYLENKDIIYLDDEGNPLIEQQDNGIEAATTTQKREETITTETTISNTNNQVKMFFGGDLASIFDDENDPLIVCLHNLTTDIAQSVSDEIMPGVYLTSHLAARGLIEESNSESSADDFYTFGGFCGWDPGQLSKEIDRGSWYLISASKDLIWNGLTKLRSKEYDPRYGGIEFWESIISKITNNNNQDSTEKTLSSSSSSEQQQQKQFDVEFFSELMLKEWATEMLLVPTITKNNNDDEEEDTVATYIDDDDIYRAIRLESTGSGDMVCRGQGTSSSLSSSRKRRGISGGTLLRAMNHEVSPFLLQNQFLHKSILLLLQETDSFSVGLVLNLPTQDTYEVPLSDGTTMAKFIIRYGGPAGNNGEDEDEDDDVDENPLIFLHNNDLLKQNGIGKPVDGSEEEDGDSNTMDVIWTCSIDQVIDGIETYYPHVTSNDFMVIKGFCVWEKQEEGSGGIVGQLRAGNFETINIQNNNDDNSNLQKEIWSTLSTQQRLLDEQSLSTNLKISSEAWHLAMASSSLVDNDDEGTTNTNNGGDARFVFNTTVPVAYLADTTMEAWMKIYLLGDAEYYW